MEPIRRGELDETLRLTEEEAEAESPLHRLDWAAEPLLVAYGTRERIELERQTTAHAAARTPASLPVCAGPRAGKDHLRYSRSLRRPDAREPWRCLDSLHRDLAPGPHQRPKLVPRSLLAARGPILPG